MPHIEPLEPQRATGRTIVVSDLHGNAALLDRTLAHAEFTQGDRLVIAGDLIDVGSDDIVALADELGATVLVGNHEAAAIMGLQIAPQNRDTIARGPAFAQRVLSDEWSLALAVGDVLVTHAGVSVALDDIIGRTGGDVGMLAATLNELFRAEVAQAVSRSPIDFDALHDFRLSGGPMGPLWFRPQTVEHVARGLRQVVGHTPASFLGADRVRELESAGWLLVEPGGHGKGRGYRYAVIDNAGARLVTSQPF